jgi:hypothetical protein
MTSILTDKISVVYIHAACFKFAAFYGTSKTLPLAPLLIRM